MSDDLWNQSDAWAEPGHSTEETDVDDSWQADIASGRAHVMQGGAISRPQSGLGISALILSVVAGVIIVAGIVGSTIIVVQNPNVPNDNPQIVVAGCGILFGLLLAVLSGILGVIGLFQPDRARTCSGLAVLFAGLEVLGTGGMCLLGWLNS